MEYLDSHTEGEPTRVIHSGLPDLGGGSVAEQAARLAAEHPHLLSSIVCEPHGHEALVGALVVKPASPEAHVGVIYFNPAGLIGMCGHGTIGLIKSLEFLAGQGVTCTTRPLPPAGEPIVIETVVGLVRATLHPDGEVTVENVPSWVHQQHVTVDVPGFGHVTGTSAYGGNWFFLVKDSPVPVKETNLALLTDLTKAIRSSLAAAGITGSDGAEIDHVEVFGPAALPGANSKNFVMCPGGAFDRSPCGTGTSAKMACLHAEGKLKAGETWIQESIMGGRFSASFQVADGGKILPTIKGRAFITASGRLHFGEDDPFVHGFRTASDC